jgi:uncharacterized membrane protein required for colicin V production
MAFDLIVLVIILWSAFAGFRKGLLAGIVKLAGKIGAVVVAFLFYKPFLSLIEGVYPLRDVVEPWVGIVLQNAGGVFAGSGPEAGTGGGLTLPEGFTLPEDGALPEDFTMPEDVAIPEGFILPESGSPLQILQTQLTDFIMNTMALVLLFIICTLVVNILVALVIQPLAEALSPADRGGGLILGFCGSFLLLSLVVGAAAPIIDANESWSVVQESMSYPILRAGYNFILSVVHLYQSETPSSLLPNLNL